MPNFDYLNLIVLILAGFAALVFIYLQRKSVEHEHAISSEEEKSYHLLHQATKKAQEILGMAELDALKVTTDSRFYKEKLENKLQQQLDAGAKISQEQFGEYLISLKQSMNKATEEFTNYLKYLKTEGDEQRNSNQEAIRQQIAQTFVKFEENLSQFLLETQQKSVQSIELELKAARGLIETYKQQQLKVIDENILAMLEQTLSLVLNKKLSLQDQIDLVYEALEKAKLEKFII